MNKTIILTPHQQHAMKQMLNFISNKSLQIFVLKGYAGTGKTTMMMRDPYLNALRAVFGFALTCHKAQGGEWEYVYLDIPRNLPGIEKPCVYQWIYTAMTRVSKELYVVNDFWVM